MEDIRHPADASEPPRRRFHPTSTAPTHIPPGTGKTWTGARLITELMRRGRRVGVAATSHKAIHNLLVEVEEAAREERLRFRGLKKASVGNDESFYQLGSIRNSTDVAAFVRAGADVLLFAGTAWLFAHEDLDRGAAATIDTLVIDEAGQVSLADALAMGMAARNVLLLGDPLQLAQVSQGTHPPGTEASVLEHLLGNHATIPPDMGVFLERTHRMHPDVCRFISEVVPVLPKSPERRRVPRDVPGLRRGESTAAGVPRTNHRANEADQRTLPVCGSR